MSRLLQSACAALLLGVLSSSCVLALGTGGSDHRTAKAAREGEQAKGADSAKAGESAGGEAGAKVAASEEAKAKKAARKAEKKEREIAYARMELAMAEMDAERELRESTLQVERAKHDVEAAQRELDHFQKVERPLEMEDQQMDLDRSTEQALEQKQELDELVAMYKKDDFAKLTKELVIQRGKFRMEMAQRDLELTRKRAQDKQTHAWAVKEHDLGLALKKSQDELADAESKLKKTQAHNELELLRARHKLEDAQRPDDDDEEGSGGSKGA